MEFNRKGLTAKEAYQRFQSNSQTFTIQNEEISADILNRIYQEIKDRADRGFGSFKIYLVFDSNNFLRDWKIRHESVYYPFVPDENLAIHINKKAIEEIIITNISKELSNKGFHIEYTKSTMPGWHRLQVDWSHPNA
jgi:hypothetical protein